MSDYRGLLAQGREVLLPHTESPFLDAALLLAHASGQSVDRVYSGGTDPVSEDAAGLYRTLLERRAAGEPVAWITGIREFWGHRFRIHPGVLVPRPDTETLVQAALEAMPDTDATRICIHDAFTGSGAVGISLALAARERGYSFSLLLSDRSPAARACAFENARVLLGSAAGPAGEWEVQPGEGLSAGGPRWYGNGTPPLLVTANPPYLTAAEWNLRRNLGWKEPGSALDGGPDGLDAYRLIAAQAPELLTPGSQLLLEIGEGQTDAVSGLLQGAGLQLLRVHTDLAGIARVLHFLWRAG